ncbi:hypothetical protein FZEAL_8222 [Fusarium zealandicum]|uniref:Uncharacterized protein n=1 Tax=Fusarium zealandicum TaxID=1053134 RepID=A0A8H4XI36_9HYPO|nr:hypothetical protein FZEAL_8222 [Fusarium zealandicum]
MSTSTYYEDPDSNEIELQVDSFGTTEEVTNFMASNASQENPVDVGFDPEAFIKRVNGGEDDQGVKLRPDMVLDPADGIGGLQ